MRHAFLIIVAVLLIILGLLGLILPFLPGILFILIGVMLLSAYNPRFEFWLHEQTKKYPPLHKVALEFKAFIERILKKK
jgi:uncharacterized protein